MVFLYSQQCFHDSCKKQPSFHFEGGKKPAYCRQRAEDTMVDIYNKQCSQFSCAMPPGCNFKGCKNPVYRMTHAEDGMVDVPKELCLNDTCDVRHCFTLEGSKAAAYCRKHACHDMVDVRSWRCVHGSCTKEPSYPFIGRKKAHCKLHAEDGMVGSRARRSHRDPCSAVGAAQCVLFDVVPNACVQPKQKILGAPVTNVSAEALSEATGCINRSGCRVNGKQPTHCLNHPPPRERTRRALCPLGDGLQHGKDTLLVLPWPKAAPRR